jgi:hypothetical protein
MATIYPVNKIMKKKEAYKPINLPGKMSSNKAMAISRIGTINDKTPEKIVR